MRLTFHVLLALVAGVLVTVDQAAAQYPTPYLTAGCWTFNGNGHQGTGANGLCITFVSGGVIRGTLYGTDPIEGFFNGVSGEISFIRSVANNGSRAAQQVFTGYWLPDNRDYPYGLKRLSGTFYAAGAPAGGGPTRHAFGWTATRSY